jgi:imidazolonepropionase-like amidohydrolase
VAGVPAAVHEMFLMHEAGLDTLRTLQSITSTAAALLRHESRLGQIRPGYVADFVATEQNPLDDLNAMRELTLVVQSGCVIRNDAA